MIGVQTNNTTINQQIGQLALSLRNDCQSILNAWQWINQIGVSGLQTLGFNATDAASLISQVNYLATVAKIYTGAATQATPYDFDNQLSPLWGGQ